MTRPKPKMLRPCALNVVALLQTNPENNVKRSQSKGKPCEDVCGWRPWKGHFLESFQSPACYRSTFCQPLRKAMTPMPITTTPMMEA